MRALAALAFALVALAVAPCAGARAQPAPRPGALVRVAALTERLLLLQAQVGQGVLAERSRRALLAEGRALAAAVPPAPPAADDAELHEELAVLEILVREYRAWSQRPATRDNARALGERAEEVVWVAEKAARILARREHARDRCEAQEVRAERVALLAQRMARLLLWRRWGVGGAVDAEAVQAELRRALDAVRGSAAAGAGVEHELQLADNQAAFLFDAAEAIEGPHAARQAQFVAKAADHLHESMQRLVAACRAEAR